MKKNIIYDNILIEKIEGENMNIKKQNNKGFTLIELLTILIVLAIIAVITIPKISKITEKSKKDGAAMSALGYIDAVEKYYAHKTKGNFNDEFELEGEYTVEDGKLKKQTEIHNVEINGAKPSRGYVNITEGYITSGCINLGKYAVTRDNSEVSNVTKQECPLSSQEE